MKRTKVTGLETIHLSSKCETVMFMDKSRKVADTCEHVSARGWLICKEATRNFPRHVLGNSIHITARSHLKMKKPGDRKHLAAIQDVWCTPRFKNRQVIVGDKLCYHNHFYWPAHQTTSLEMFFVVYMTILGEDTTSEVPHCIIFSPAPPLLRAGFFSASVYLLSSLGLKDQVWHPYVPKG